MTGESLRVAHLQNDYLHTKQIVEQRRAKRRKGLIRRLAVFAVLFAAVCTIMISSLVSQNREWSEAQIQKQTLQKKIASSTAEAAQLKKRIKLLHDKQYIGEIARHDYLLSGKGEIIFSKPEKQGH